MSSKVHSMTGFSSAEGALATEGAATADNPAAGAPGLRLRVEMKALNHRFLDVKVRLPRELSSVEMPLRSLIQSRFARGTIDIKIERITESGTAPVPVRADLELATQYFKSMKAIQQALGLSEPIRTADIIQLPDVISRTTAEISPDDAWKRMEPLVQTAIERLEEMRAHEGAALVKALLSNMEEMEATLEIIRKRRAENAASYREKIGEKVKSIFEAYPIAESSVQSVLESRIAQELSLLLDRTDIEEEITRFRGHLDHLRKTLKSGGPVGRKLDFILQELHREINTLGNKAQDFMVSEEVVQTKVRLEQLREQVMNLE